MGKFTNTLKKGLEAVGNYKNKVAAAKKTLAEAKAIKTKAKGEYHSRKRLASIAKTAIRNVTAQRIAEEETKQKQASLEAANVQALAKWNAAINNTAEPAENTGAASSGTRGVTVIGNE